MSRSGFARVLCALCLFASTSLAAAATPLTVKLANLSIRFGDSVGSTDTGVSSNEGGPTCYYYFDGKLIICVS